MVKMKMIKPKKKKKNIKLTTPEVIIFLMNMMIK